MRISVIGLGKLGSPLAAVLAAKGHEVVGTDQNERFVAALAAGEAPVAEPGLQELISVNSDRIAATTSIAGAVSRTDATFVVVPTPSGADGTFSNAYVLAAMRDIGGALRSKEAYHLVVVTSTVMPGSTGGVIREAIETAAGARVGERIGLCYSPELIALGSVVRDMLNPDLILIGESDTRAGDLLEQIYRGMCDNRPPIHRMNFVNAELTKMGINAYVTTKISFANMLADICDRLPQADATVVAAAIGSDSRIGGKYLKPALGYGGPCFPRDSVAFAALARELGARADISEATDQINRHQITRIAALVARLCPRGTVGILGLSYKVDTAVIEQSPGVVMAGALSDAGHRVVAFDPQAMEPAMAVLGNKIAAAADADACAAAADVLIIATPWPAFKKLARASIVRQGRPLPVIDCWHLLPPEEFADTVELVYLGRGSDTAISNEPLSEAESLPRVGLGAS